MSWQQLAEAHFKVKVAQKYELAMHQPKKKTTKKEAESGSSNHRDDSHNDGVQLSSSHYPQLSASAGSSSDSLDSSHYQTCPLKTTASRSMITEEDVVNAIAPLTHHKSAVMGIGYSTSQQREGVGRVVQRWKMGLDLQQFITSN